MDELDFEVTEVRSRPHPSAAAGGTRPTPPGTLLSPGWRLALAAGSILLALVVIVSVWLPLLTKPPSRTAVVPSPTSFATATPVLAPTPLPITSALAAPPTNCPSAPSLTTVTVPVLGVSGGPVQLTGRGPAWIHTSYPPPSVVGVTAPNRPSSANPEWPFIQVTWVLGPDAPPQATVQVHDLASQTLAWWGAAFAASPQMPMLTLNPPADIPAHSYVAGAPWDLFITRAGCYQMDVTWPGGSWSLIFAAGASSS